MKQEKKIRTQISLAPELDERVNKLADKMGMSKPQLCSMLVAQQIDMFEKTWAMMQNPVWLNQFAESVMKITGEDISEDVAKFQSKTQNK